MTTTIDGFMHQQLLDRRDKLQQAVRHNRDFADLQHLLNEVASALARMDAGSYGICETCHDPIELDRLISDPLVRFCLDHLTPPERTALERDLELAAQVQKGLLPAPDFNYPGWDICYHYEPAGLVSGDYLDVIDAGSEGLYFMVGDVSGKGVAASMLMTHLHAMFRSLLSVKLPLGRMLEHASQVFAGSTLPNQYATLVCGRALPDGRVEIANAGHPAPLVLRGADAVTLDVADLPIGLFARVDFSVSELQFEPGQGLMIYSDGVSEAANAHGFEYGSDRLRELVGVQQPFNASSLLSACRNDLSLFRKDTPKSDDVTLFVLGRSLQAV